ncbi:response regulator transcription factor [Campylobacter sp. LR291e]|uniref:two-component system response regulator DccR n=1 Tax=unclassified Campylobacter TaxID=2593542 RepID=UPI001237A187|nr:MULTISPECIES: response regulator transcription factor [unclassified Campylobacter]KAA6226563.1 response regulator transcription factor [Campylobacter sp. LR185c]KAA6230328.1 response regulator transcription factor [Campylobacter sp. LR291e]KAA6233848.1 response regulator transcription factor [Campylobacter sp. LR264d]KAA8603631.1 two-component system response regulator [Campylobacter sp. LR185c]
MAAKILLLEDDSSLNEIVEEYLSDEGYEVSVCEDAQQALDLAYEKHFDLWILDVKVPLGDGFSLLDELRKSGKNTPAIFMTSLNTLQDLQSGYNVGCDDYIKKPFELAELAMRVQTLLKRAFSHNNDDFVTLPNGFKFNLNSQLLYQNDKSIVLPSKEIKLLTMLLKNKNNFLTQEQIFEELWEYGEEPSELSLRVYIKNLRKIIGKDAIINQRGRGYCYVGS